MAAFGYFDVAHKCPKWGREQTVRFGQSFLPFQTANYANALTPDSRSPVVSAMADARVFAAGRWSFRDDNAELHTLHHLGGGVFAVPSRIVRAA